MVVDETLEGKVMKNYIQNTLQNTCTAKIVYTLIKSFMIKYCGTLLILKFSILDSREGDAVE